jgi:hypothetical protein
VKEAWIICVLHIQLNGFQYLPYDCLQLFLSTESLFIKRDLRFDSLSSANLLIFERDAWTTSCFGSFLDHTRLSIESMYSLRRLSVQCSILGSLRLSHTSIFDWEGSVIGYKKLRWVSHSENECIFSPAVFPWLMSPLIFIHRSPYAFWTSDCHCFHAGEYWKVAVQQFIR